MTSPQNITLLKHTDTSADIKSILQLKQQTKKKLHYYQHRQNTIVHLQNNVAKCRVDFRNLSQNVNKMIEKKLLSAPQERPNMYPGSENKKISQMYNQRANLHTQIEELRIKIQQLRSNEQKQLIAQIVKKQKDVENTEKQLSKLKQDKKYLSKSMNVYKQRLQQLAQSLCLKDIDEQQIIYEQNKKQLRDLQRSYYNSFSEEVFANMYEFEVKSVVSPKKQKQGEEDRPVDKKKITSMLQQVNSLLEDRKRIDKQHQNIISQKKKQIEILSQNNNQIQKQIREFMNQSLKIKLDQDAKKRYFSEHKKSTSATDLDPQKQKNNQFSQMLQKKLNEVKKNNSTANINVGPSKQLNEKNTVAIIPDQLFHNSQQYADWRDFLQKKANTPNFVHLNDMKILSRYYDGESSTLQISKLNLFVHKTKNILLGAQCIYQVQGHPLNGANLFEDYEGLGILQSIDMQKVSQIQWCPKQQSITFLKFYLKNAQQIDDIEQKKSEDIVKIIGNSENCKCQNHESSKFDLISQTIKTIQIVLSTPTPQNPEHHLLAMRIILTPRFIQEKIIVQEIEQEEGKLPVRSFSVSDLTGKKKKVILRGAKLRKITDTSGIVDHRLLLNRKKLV